MKNAPPFGRRAALGLGVVLGAAALPRPGLAQRQFPDRPVRVLVPWAPGGTTDVQMRAEAGVAVGVNDGTSLQATGGVESGTTTAPQNWTGRLQLNVPLDK